MISGSVDGGRQAIIRLVVIGAHGREQEIAGVIDTGYSGSLQLPTGPVAALGLPFRGRGRPLLVDGSESIFDVHGAAVLWDGRRRRVFVDVAVTDPLVGMGLLVGYELTVQVIPGGNVRIAALERDGR